MVEEKKKAELLGEFVATKRVGDGSTDFYFLIHKNNMVYAINSTTLGHKTYHKDMFTNKKKVKIGFVPPDVKNTADCLLRRVMNDGK